MVTEVFTAELSAQLADARSTTTAKLDAPVNKLARLLNSPSIKRVLLNDTLRVDFDRVIAGAEVLIVKGALGGMGAGNTSVLMQLLVGMLDAALARQQDLVRAEHRVAVALKVDEAPLVINRGFAETMALKRSAGLETVACWQTDAQWTEREVRDQLDALFAHRVYFATASTRDAREAVRLTMAEFSDTVRPGVERLSSLGRPDVRLHLPRHHAIASWVTPEGRQPPFVAETVPLSIDRERLALHAVRQRERGGQHLGDLRQPHWDRHGPPGRSAGNTDVANNGQLSTPGNGRGGSSNGMPRASSSVPPPAQSHSAERAELPRLAAESYRELVELDGAHSVRWAKEVSSPCAVELDELDLRMLELIAAMEHVLTSQLHRHCNPERAATTTQRRLKRLWDASLVGRFQFHRRDGGGIPMCYVIAPAGMRALAEHGRRVTEESEAERAHDRPARARADGRGTVVRDDSALRQARHHVHVTGWAFALAAALGDERTLLQGPAQSLLSPARGTHGEHGGVLSPDDLRLPGGRTPHEFLRSDGSGQRMPVERFETIRPDATVVLAAPAANRQTTDVLVELDDRAGTGAAARKLERYDHFLAGWSAHTRRYGPRREAAALVVFVCRDRARARECARSADSVLCASRAYAGEYPFEWEYPGREGIVFVAERDAHEGLTRAFGVPRLPPAVRVRVAHGDPRAGEATAEARQIEAGGAPAGPPARISEP